MSTNYLAIIPARGGSKRIPGKNLKKVGGISLVGRAIIAAMQSKLVTHIAITTDHPDIIQEAWHWCSTYRYKGKHVYIVNRPDGLASDDAPLDAALVHATREVQEKITGSIESVVTLQPTSPFRPAGLIDRCIRIQRDTYGINSVLTVHDPGHFMWVWDDSHPTVKDRYRQVNAKARQNSQNIPHQEHYWAENGCVYVTDSYALLCTGKRTIFHSMVVPISLPQAMDIDTEADYQLAEQLCSSLQ